MMKKENSGGFCIGVGCSRDKKGPLTPGAEIINAQVQGTGFPLPRSKVPKIRGMLVHLQQQKTPSQLQGGGFEEPHKHKKEMTVGVRYGFLQCWALVSTSERQEFQGRQCQHHT
jgi:hypothetical protein